MFGLNTIYLFKIFHCTFTSSFQCCAFSFCYMASPSMFGNEILALAIFNVLSPRLSTQMSLLVFVIFLFLFLLFGFFFIYTFFHFPCFMLCHVPVGWGKWNNFRSYYAQQGKCPIADRSSWCDLLCISISFQYVPVHNISGDLFLCIILLIMKNEQESESVVKQVRGNFSSPCLNASFSFSIWVDWNRLFSLKIYFRIHFEKKPHKIWTDFKASKMVLTKYFSKFQ